MKTCLQFSGGKDSLACLYLFREQWDEILVAWVNTGAAYPSTVEYMARWAERLPHFLEIKTNQPAQIEENGYPADVVPMRSTPLGRLAFKGEAHEIQSLFACCHANLWYPMQAAMKERGIDTIIRGQRREEGRTAPITNGYIDQSGFQYILPIEDWSCDQVFDYLRSVDADMPDYYETERTSRDCWDCTAYADENKERVLALPDEMRALVLARMKIIRDAVAAEMQPLNTILESAHG